MCSELVESESSNNIKNEYGRTPFLRDYGIIIHSSIFRRMAYKTQVYLNPQADYVRTRLTHSIEVSQIGRQLARAFINKIPQDLKKSYEDFDRDFEDLVATTCLAHDLGQPPFGHLGERTLNKLIKNEHIHLSFEANKQNIRLLVGSQSRSYLKVTKALTDSVLKYKDKNIYPTKAYGSYKFEESKMQEISKDLGTNNYRHPACYLMEASDDIAYICSDIEDALKFKIIKVEELFDKINTYTEFKILNDDYDIKDGDNWNDFFKNNESNYYKISSQLIKIFIKHVIEGLSIAINKKNDFNNYPNFLENFIKNNNQINKEKLNYLYWGKLGSQIYQLKTYIYEEKILKNREIAHSEILAKKVIEGLWNELLPLVNEKEFEKLKIYLILPENVQNKIKSLNHLEINNDERFQILADYISGMTDRFAIELYTRLNSPSRLLFAG
jgi:dGTPase